MEKKQRLKVLLTNHHLLDYTGSEVYTLTLADYLKQNGCDVVVYSKYVDKIGKEFKKLNIPVVYHLEEIKGYKFDVAHVHHNINAAEIRYFFPELPIALLSHGIIPFLEQPSVFNLNISHYLSVSEEVKQNLTQYNISEKDISVIGNIIDNKKFFSSKPVNPIPQNILVISAKISDEKALRIIEACNSLNIQYKFVGGKFGEVNQEELLKLINNSDIIFSLGRGAIEAMLCKRAVIVYDVLAADGLITPENFDEIKKHNFSGRRFNKELTTNDLIEEIKKYNPLDTEKLYRKVFEIYSAEVTVPKLINIYYHIISKYASNTQPVDQGLLKVFYQSLQETRTYSTILARRQSENSEKQKKSLNNDEQIKYKIKVKTNTLLSKTMSHNNLKDFGILNKKNYDVLIPIYNAYDQVKTCVESVLRNTAYEHKIYLLDDASPDKRILPLLNKFAENDKRVIVLPSENNLGFIGNMNRGFALSENDVIILNSDTQVTPNWIEKMHSCVSSNANTGIVSPLSNNATILSVPEMNASNKLPEKMSVDEFAELVFNASNHSYPEIPTAVGFCMLIKREVLSKVGFFDPIFGLGYGEENDLCERAKTKGYKILCCDDTYVHHYGEASFSFVDKIDERRKNNQLLLEERYPDYNKEIFSFCRENPLRIIQEKIFFELKKYENNSLPHILNVVHNFNAPGGTELHTKDIANFISNSFRISIMYPAALGYSYTDAKTKFIFPNIREIQIAKENNMANEHFNNNPGDIFSGLIEKNFANFLYGGDYDIVHFQHLLNWSTLLLPFIAKQSGKKIVISLHDYFFLCPDFNMIFPVTNKKCGKKFADARDNECLYCISSKRKRRNPENAQPIQDYLDDRYNIIKAIFEVADLLIAPSQFVKDKFIEAYGSFITEKIIVVNHGIQKLDYSPRPKFDKVLRIGFLGNATSVKGIFTLLETVKKLNRNIIQIEIFGNVAKEFERTLQEFGVKINGGYDRKQLPRLLSKTNALIIPSIWDETYALTLSEAMSMGICVIASDSGALTERISDGVTGLLFKTSDSNSLREKIMYLYNNPELLIKIQDNLKQLQTKTLADNAKDYLMIYKELLNKNGTISIVENKLNQYQDTLKQKIIASIIVLTYNALHYTQKFYESILKTVNSNYELIIIDNASIDGTKEYLNSISLDNKNVKLIFNDKNLGFPAAVNQGIHIAKGKYILIANNDIVVTQSWLERLIEVVESDNRIGIVGPISNEVSGVQRDKEADYKTIDEMHLYADSVREKNKNKITQFPRVAFLCTLIKKDVIEKIGGLDERFSPGNFEDDDFCLRAQLAGYKTVIAQDVFIHHYGSKSFKADGEKKYADRLKVNHQIFVAKWGADPDEIWLKQKPFNHSRGLFISIDKDEFIKAFERAQNNIKDKEFDLALINIELALKYFESSEKAVSIMSKEDLLILAANISLIVKDIEKARQLFEETLKLNPSSSEACFGLGQVFYQAEMFEESKTMFEWAVKNNPQNQTAAEALKSVNEVLSLPENHNSLLENAVEQVGAEK
jgi:GT2 family glycosyltransferase/glycosyltransferase involved in cell wall biosynthesis